jgi:hypothetical protein
MKTSIRADMHEKLKASGLTFEALFAELVRVLSVTHMPVGFCAGSPADQTLGIDNMLQADMQLNDNVPPRSLMERLLWRFKAQHVVDKHNLENHKRHFKDVTNDAERSRLGIDLMSRCVACQGIWIWALKEGTNIVEHQAIASAVAIQERKREDEGDRKDESEGNE